MGLASYADLVSALQSYNDNSQTLTPAVCDDCIVLAERRIFHGGADPFPSQALRCRDMEASTSLAVPPYVSGGTSTGTSNAQAVTAAGVAPARGYAVSFVAGFTNTAAVTLNVNGTGAVAVKKDRGRYDLEDGDIQAGQTVYAYHDGATWVLTPPGSAAPLPPRFLAMRTVYAAGRSLDYFHSDDLAEIGGPSYTVEGGWLVVSPDVAAGSGLEIKYYRGYPALKDRLNDIFTAAPHIYLWAALLEAAIYLQDNENMTKWHGMFTSALESFATANTAGGEGRTRYASRVNSVVV